MTAPQPSTSSRVAEPLLSVDELYKRFTVGKTIVPGRGQVVHAVDGVSFDVFPGETLGLVGEVRVRQVDPRPLPCSPVRG